MDFFDPQAPVRVVAEIGINHNGSVQKALELIKVAKGVGCDAVKFQKRTVSQVYTTAELDQRRASPFGTTNRELKYALELNSREYKIIDLYCKEVGMPWFCSCWDEASVEKLNQYNILCHKVASPCLTDLGLIQKMLESNRPLIMSTGMSTVEEIDRAVDIVRKAQIPYVLLHSVSSYPTKPEDVNLQVISFLQYRYKVPVGFSGHEPGIQAAILSVAHGARIVEKHLTMNRLEWGSDQSVSLEPAEFQKLVEGVRYAETVAGTAQKRLLESEQPARAKLRRA